MKRSKLLLLLVLLPILSFSQIKTIHVFVALCDNENQGIVPVPESLGNGQDPNRNLYWGASFGVKTFLKRNKGWNLIRKIEIKDSMILERLLFKHSGTNTYLLADAYDGAYIQDCTEDFLLASNAQTGFCLKEGNENLGFGGDAGLVAYCGHDGLMEFNVFVDYGEVKVKKRDVIILACYSRDFFTEEIKKAQANPILWTTHLMAPEAYTLVAAMDAWIKENDNPVIHEAAASAYHKFQKCGMSGARNLFATGFED